MVKLIWLTLTFTLLAGLIEANESPSCRDEEGNAVDWWIAYKFPQFAYKSGPLGTGYGYAYVTSKGQSSTKWVVSKKSIIDKSSIVLNSIAVTYSGRDGISHLFYNDAPPKEDNPNSGRAHAKGILIIDDNKLDSLWLTHSIPKFPPTKSENPEFEENFRLYGQTLMCVSIDLRKSGSQVVDHLYNLKPLVYDYEISHKIEHIIPKINDLIGEKQYRKRNAATKLVQTITTKAGQELSIISKSNKYGQDFYSSLLDQELRTGLYAQTWRRGSGEALESFCPRSNFHVNNISNMKIVSGGDKLEWSYLRDHAKWAISQNEDAGLVCIGDMNRMGSQFKRGGGAICLKCPTCWSIFSNTIHDIEPCPKKSKKAVIES